MSASQKHMFDRQHLEWQNTYFDGEQNTCFDEKEYLFLLKQNTCFDVEI